MTNRRQFIRLMTAAGIAGAMPVSLWGQDKTSEKKIWAKLVHLSYNMWEDNVPLKYRDENYECTTCQEAREWAHPYRSFLTFDDKTWNTLLNDMASSGINMVLLDLGDAVQYESHPEIAVRGAWTKEKLRAELAKMRKMGLEPIPKLNFATTHDIWMGEYSRMVSTKKYYEVCSNLIAEVIELFETPRFFHLGMDEELAGYQRSFDHVVLRQNDLWWGDLYFLMGETEKRGVRSWIWSDYAWHNPDKFFNKMPKSVLQSNWYYGARFDVEQLSENNQTYIRLYDKLEQFGYDQVPTGSNHSNDENMEGTVDYCKKVIDSSRLKGFMTAPWRPIHPACLEQHQNAIKQLQRAIKKFG